MERWSCVVEGDQTGPSRVNLVVRTASKVGHGHGYANTACSGWVGGLVSSLHVGELLRLEGGLGYGYVLRLWHCGGHIASMLSHRAGVSPQHGWVGYEGTPGHRVHPWHGLGGMHVSSMMGAVVGGVEVHGGSW